MLGVLLSIPVFLKAQYISTDLSLGLTKKVIGKNWHSLISSFYAINYPIRNKARVELNYIYSNGARAPLVKNYISSDEINNTFIISRQSLVLVFGYNLTKSEKIELTVQTGIGYVNNYYSYIFPHYFIDPNYGYRSYISIDDRKIDCCLMMGAELIFPVSDCFSFGLESNIQIERKDSYVYNNFFIVRYTRRFQK